MIENSILEIDGVKYQGCFKILRVWGTKHTGRHALIGIAKDRTAADNEDWIKQFEHSIKWSKGDPYEAIYDDLKDKYLRNPLSKAFDDLKEIFNG